VIRITNEAIAVPALTPRNFCSRHCWTGRGRRSTSSVARKQHGWPPRVLFKARQGMRVNAIRRGFGPGGYWIWKLPDHMTDKDVHFHPGEWRGFVAGRRKWLTPAG
jgi:hypothetical protein